MKEMELYKYKLIVALLSGWLALFFSKYAIQVDSIKIIWSLIFPLMIVMIWEYEYAVITGVGGLAIFIPFYIYPDRGYGNVLTTLLYFILLIVDAIFIAEEDMKKSSLKIYLIHIIYGCLFIAIHSSLYFKLLYLNPEGYAEPIRRVMANSVLAIQNVNFICSVIMLTAIAKVLFRLPFIRAIYKLEKVPNSNDNYKIILKTIFLLIGFGLVNLAANGLYASSMGVNFGVDLFQFTTAGVIKGMLIISAAFMVCDYAIFSDMLQKEAIAKDKMAQKEIIKLNEGLEQAVTERTQELKRAYSDLESFSYMVSHEIKTPIREIEAYVSILEEDNRGILKPESLSDIDSVKRVCQDTIVLAQSMMEYAKVGYSIMKSEKIQMRQLVIECFQELRLSNPQREMECSVGVLPDLNGDRFLLSQAILNILSNSIKFSANRDKTQITVWAEERNGNKCYYFKDNGIGFEKDFGKGLFHLFQRAHDRSDFEGNGIGLATVKRIIERHGGCVEIHSEKDKGCQILIRL